MDNSLRLFLFKHSSADMGKTTQITNAENDWCSRTIKKRRKKKKVREGNPKLSTFNFIYWFGKDEKEEEEEEGIHLNSTPKKDITRSKSGKTIEIITTRAVIEILEIDRKIPLIKFLPDRFKGLMNLICLEPKDSRVDLWSLRPFGRFVREEGEVGLGWRLGGREWGSTEWTASSRERRCSIVKLRGLPLFISQYVSFDILSWGQSWRSRYSKDYEPSTKCKFGYWVDGYHPDSDSIDEEWESRREKDVLCDLLADCVTEPFVFKYTKNKTNR